MLTALPSPGAAVVFEFWFFDIIGSAEALPILCVSDFCERERERERERETPVMSFDITLKSRVIMHNDYLDGASTQRVDAF